MTVHDYNFHLTKNMFSLQNQEIYHKNLSSVMVDKSKSQGRNKRRNMVIIRNRKVTTYSYPVAYIYIVGRIISKTASSKLFRTSWVKRSMFWYDCTSMKKIVTFRHTLFPKYRLKVSEDMIYWNPIKGEILIFKVQYTLVLIWTVSTFIQRQIWYQIYKSL